MARTSSIKQFKKSEREIHVLMGLVRLYLKTLKPVGSNNLRENGFESLSSATIRNYCSKLEELGFVEQAHTSGGRIPTWRAFKLYAEKAEKSPLPKSIRSEANLIGKTKTKKVFELLQKATEQISLWSSGAAFISMPHFEQDSIIDIYLVDIDSSKLLGILITSFGMIHTHTLFIDHKLSKHARLRIETCLKAQLARAPMPQKLSESELSIAEQIYQELLTRYLLAQSDGPQNELYKTGFSRLLKHPHLQDSKALAGALSIFEKDEILSSFTRATLTSNTIHTWIGNEMLAYAPETKACAACAINYTINHIPVGAIGLLLPLASDYPALFALLEELAAQISHALERNIYTYKLSWKENKKSSHTYLLEHSQNEIEHKKGPE